jgi:alpha-beta hydrolase superfamily lysophospholipase
VGIDQRGFGHSEGRPGMIESEAFARDDLVTYSLRLKLMYGDDVPIYMVGHSLGGALSILVATSAPDTVKGVTLLAPFLGFHNPEALSKIMPIAKVVNWIRPTHKFKLNPEGNVFAYNEHFFNDKKCRSLQVSAQNAVLNETLLKKLHEKYIPRFQHPLLTIECD